MIERKHKRGCEYLVLADDREKTRSWMRKSWRALSWWDKFDLLLWHWCMLKVTRLPVIMSSFSSHKHMSFPSHKHMSFPSHKHMSFYSCKNMSFPSHKYMLFSSYTKRSFHRHKYMIFCFDQLHKSDEPPIFLRFSQLILKSLVKILF